MAEPVARRLRGVWLGRRPYAETYALQTRLFELRKAREVGDSVLFVEHDSVITLGRGAKPGDVLADAALLAERGIDRVETDRGGEVTLHAPGQLVCYPIVGLAPDRCDVRRYVNDLAQVMRRLLLPQGVDAGLIPGLVGLWVDRESVQHWPGAAAAVRPAKIGAIGVRISRWVTMHGFALNLSVDLELFRLIVPCGIRQYGVTSLAELKGPVAPLKQWLEPALLEVARALGGEPVGLVDAAKAAPQAVVERLAGLSRASASIL